MGHVNSFVVVLSVLTALFAPQALISLFTAPRSGESETESQEYDYR